MTARYTSSFIITARPGADWAALLAEAKAYLGIDYADKDAMLTQMLKTANALVERAAGQTLWAADVVENVSVIDAASTPFAVDLRFPAAAAPTAERWESGTWAAFADFAYRGGRTVEITTDAPLELKFAYTTTPCTEPDAFKLAVFQVLAAIHDNRQDGLRGAVRTAQDAVKALNI